MPCEHELCQDCVAALPKVPLPICLYCGAPVGGEQEDPYRCSACSGRVRSFDFARSALISSEQALQLVYRLKYHHANYLAPALGRILHSLWENTPDLRSTDWALAPVPAGSTHLFERGYNQAEELALALGRLRGLPVISPLVRLEQGVEKSQTRLSASERWRNAQRSYSILPAWQKGHKSLPPNIVLVDDVYTTGSTTRVCARLLKSLPGVNKVAVLTLLRATR